MRTGKTVDADGAARRQHFLSCLRATLQSPEGYLVVLELLRQLGAFLPTDTADSLARRDFAEDFFTDIEEAAPQEAMRLFAGIRGFMM